MKLTGSCHCKAIVFHLTEAPHSSCICHCIDCQKQSGGMSMPAASFQKEAFTLDSGTLQEYNSSPKVVRTFCGTCGSPIGYHHADRPNIIEIFTGSLDNLHKLNLEAHIWVSEKVPWDTICDDIPQRKKD